MNKTDWPTTMPEFLARFGTDLACRDYLFLTVVEGQFENTWWVVGLLP